MVDRRRLQDLRKTLYQVTPLRAEDTERGSADTRDWFVDVFAGGNVDDPILEVGYPLPSTWGRSVMGVPSSAVQPGIDYPRSFHELTTWFGEEEACLPYLERVRWGDGFVCRFCGTVGGEPGPWPRRWWRPWRRQRCQRHRR